MAEIPSIGPLRGSFPREIPLSERKSMVSDSTHNFHDTLKGLIQDVDQMQKTAEESSRRLVTGQIEDVHQVMIAMEEAQTSFQLMMEIRNKIIDAYKEILRLQV